ncbi:hypothetical protein G9A89_003336 [Geosiphon pyriformis]|nr:hypothetical protein G9A89_003336 [Geosiphon pyriformis]
MKNEEKAFEFYSKATKAGHTNAQLNHGNCYLNGRGITKYQEKVFELHSKAAKMGSLIAQVKLRTYYRNRQEITKDQEKVGSLSLQTSIGMHYRNRWGTKKNRKGTFEFYLKTAVAGNQNAQYNLGWCYQNGWGTTINLAKAVGLYLKIAEFIAHLTSATCKYILECYGITKDVKTDEYIMVLPFAEHGDLRAFLKNETTLTWEMFLHILFQIASGLRFIHESELVHGDLHPGNILVLKTNPLKVVISDLGLCRPADYSPWSSNIYGILEYLASEICKGAPHTKYSDIYSFAIISCKIISGERPLNNTNPIHVLLDVIKGKRPTIKKHTPQCIQEMIEKNWHCDPQYRSTAEKLQQIVIAARDSCNLNELVREKRLNSEEIKGAQHDATRYKSQLISNFTCSMSGKTFIYHI